MKATAPALAAYALDQAHDGLEILKLIEMAGYTSTGKANQALDRLFGFRVSHPVPGDCRWEDGGPVSTPFRHRYEGRQPPLDQTEVRQLLPGVADAEIALEFEKEGLRTKISRALESADPADSR